MTKADGPVLVGVDGSEESLEALRWAIAEADLRRAEVRLVAANDDPPRDEEIWQMLQELGRRYRDEYPHLDIYEKIARGQPATELIRRSPDAQLIVLGSRGRGALTSTLLGSVSARVALDAHCPVVVVREHPAEGPVVVGIDDSPGSHAALQFAFDAATARKADLHAIHVWQNLETWLAPASGIEWVELNERVRHAVATELAGWAEKYPNVQISKVVDYGHPVAELTQASRTAQLLVVGHRGRGGFTGMLLGSVASGVLHDAKCPVAVARDDAEPAE